MITRYRVSLDGVQMDSLDNNIYILDVQYSPITRRDTTHEVANLDGYDLENSKYVGQTVTVTFELHIYDTKKRNAACQKINQWAGVRGALTVNDREGQYLRTVKCDQYAAINSVRNWTDPLTLVFSTERTPFWLSNTEKALTISGKNVNGTLKLDGNISYSLVTAEITANEKVTSLQITVGSTKLNLKGLNVATNKKVVIDYVNQRYLRIRADGASVMSKLQPESTDNLQAPCGANTKINLVSDGKVTAVFKGRGCWI